MGLSPFLFLSYRSLERGFASRLSADLKNAGVGLWMDSLDIKPGEDWDRSIESAMDRCTAVVAIISPAYVTSDVCRAELGRAHALGRPVFPVLLEAVEAAQWPLLLQNRQYVDFTGRRDDAAYEAGLSELLTALHERFGGIDGATPDPERRYLNALLAELEAARGVLEYLPLDTVTAAGTPRHVSPDEWAFDVLLDVGTSTPEQHTTKLSSVEDLLRQGGNVALLGDAGAGKTTTLRWIARRAALMRAAEPRTRPLPVLGYLGQWPGDRSVEEFLGDLCPVLPSAEALDSGSDMIILLDGLNEMGAEASGRIDELRRWLGTRPANWSVIVTCRSADFAALELPGLTTATLRELDDDRIRRFAARYLLADAPRFLDQVLAPANGKADASVVVSDLARNPYMLSAFIYLFQHRPGHPLPSNTGALFAKLANALWERERRRPAGPSETWPTARRALGRMARMTIEEGNGTREDIRVSSAAQLLGDERLLGHALAAGMLVRHGYFVRFYHDLLRTYFVAESLTDLAPEAFLAWCRAHLQHWEQVAVAWSGISRHADLFFEQLQWQDAAELAGRGYSTSEHALSRHVDRAIQELRVGDWRSFQPAIDALVQIGPRAVHRIIPLLDDPDAEVREKAVFVLGRIGNETAVEALLPLFDDLSADVRTRLASALQGIGGRRALTTLSVQRFDESPYVRAAALQAMITLGEPGSSAVVSEMLDDPDPKVRRAAIDGIGELVIHDAATTVAAHLEDSDAEIRAAALTTLVRLGTDVRPQALAAVQDSDRAVRQAGIEVLESLGADGAPALLAVLSSASPDVRAGSAAALGRLGHSAALGPLSAALTDPDWDVRKAAATALGRFGDAARDELIAMLRGHDSWLWQTAAEALGRVEWTPATSADEVRVNAANGDWARCLGLGEAAVPELRTIMTVADPDRRTKAAETLETLGWRPGADDPDVITFYEHLADWEQHQRLSVLDLMAWIGPPTRSRPAHQAGERLLAMTGRSICDERLEAALASTSPRSRYFATVLAGITRCAGLRDQVTTNLTAPSSEEVIWGWRRRCAAAQALVDLTPGEAVEPVALHLLDRAATTLAGTSLFDQAEAHACIQSVARMFHAEEAFEELPATALGRSLPDDHALRNIWFMFRLEDSPLEEWSVSDIVSIIADFDRSRLPAFSPFYSDTALVSLHQRLAILTLVLVSTIESEPLRGRLDQVLDCFPADDIVPVLREVSSWSDDHSATFATTHLARLERDAE